MYSMGDILDSPIVLRLNGNYQRLGFSTVAETFTAMMGGSSGSAPYLALDIEYELKPDGTPDFAQMKSFRPIPWDEWRMLSIQPWHMTINGVRQKIRVPEVVMCPKFTKTIMKEQRATPSNIRKRDGNVCQYTGVPLTNKTFSLDHVVPKSKGGKDSWANLVSAHKDINSKKGNRFNHEAGLKLKKRPAVPKPIPLSAMITEMKHPAHCFFP
jgi:5-methylcytosine-specific restriction endonuclease McrA